MHHATVTIDVQDQHWAQTETDCSCHFINSPVGDFSEKPNRVIETKDLRIPTKNL